MIRSTQRSRGLVRRNIATARLIWPSEMSNSLLKVLRELTTRLSLSVHLGELQLISANSLLKNSIFVAPPTKLKHL